MPVPSARGPLSAALLELLTEQADNIAAFVATARDFPATEIFGDDAQLTLTLLYELHLHGIQGVADTWEWSPELIAARGVLDSHFLTALRELVGPQTVTDVVEDLWALADSDDGPSLSAYLATRGSLDQWREFLIHRSLNQLREFDVYSLGVARLSGAPKAALIEVQADEYGGGRVGRMHSTLYATTMRELSLNDGYANYLDVLPAVTLTEVNALSMFGLRRGLIGALVGNLCMVEATSAAACKRYAAGLSRLGFGAHATRFFDEHVEADSMHEQVVIRDLARGLVEQSPELGAQVLFGAAAHLELGARSAHHLMDSWAAESTSLRAPSGPITPH